MGFNFEINLKYRLFLARVEETGLLGIMEGCCLGYPIGRVSRIFSLGFSMSAVIGPKNTTCAAIFQEDIVNFRSLPIKKKPVSQGRYRLL